MICGSGKNVGKPEVFSYVGEKNLETKGLITNLLSNRGLKNYQLSRYDAALKDYELALRILTSFRNPFEEENSVENINLQAAKILSNQGQVRASMNELSKALEIYQNALEKLKGLKNSNDSVKTTEAIIKNNIGVVFEILRQFPAAETTYKEALQIQKRLNQNANVGVAFNNLVLSNNSF